VELEELEELELLLSELLASELELLGLELELLLSELLASELELPLPSDEALEVEGP
jgi:hypothetical protein